MKEGRKPGTASYEAPHKDREAAGGQLDCTDIADT